ncbi:type II toxin-antitoxin system RelE/ParE family toxin [Endobacterium cereale]|uniref:type II toxin-antitoxin system RelE/ParE family toxin n=1 Tax=Endobacterium cereale TaxID=2663029 RepID=UPI002B49C1B9|nr:type II toxin-antitoxin system RelE/ParE family toxin [Endobacterium cereale]MEB2843862.1 type II toxin-antitoxin system RelE/ParE family toxin [Endobacterium cereale]
MTIRFTDSSSRQIDEALTHVRERSPSGAEGTSLRLSEILDLRASQPKAGQRTNRPSTRRLVLTPYQYIIFYRLHGNEVIITRFIHAARRPRG